MYLSRSCKTECTNAWYNVRNAAVCIVYVWMGGHQLLPGKQSAEPMPWHVSKFLTPKTHQNLSKYWCTAMAVVSSAQIQWAAVTEPEPAQHLWEGIHVVQALSSTGRMSSKSQRCTEPFINCDNWAIILRHPGQQASSLLLAVLYFQNIPLTSAVSFRHPRSALCF